MKSQRVLKQVVGIDVGKDEFYVCYKVQYEDNSTIIKGTKSFDNTILGMQSFLKWSEKRNRWVSVAPIYVMEATGIYYENLAYFLYENGKKVSVHLAQKLKYYAKSCNLKTKTDKVDAKMIAAFGIERNLEIAIWTPPSKEFKLIRDLSREHTSLKQNLTALKSQLHALNHAHATNKKVITIKKEMIVFYEAQLKIIEKELKKLVESDKELYSKIEKIKTVKGLGFITIVKVLSEVNGFLLFKNIRQLVSYAGLDIVKNESGKHEGKTRISKKGNPHLRTALYMPAMTAIRCNKNLKAFYERINEGRKIKKQGLIAVMRKLLILIYTLWKKNEVYIDNYKSI